MKNAFIIHGLGGSPSENWFPWLKAQLDPKIKTYVPAFPSGVHHNLKDWALSFEAYKQFLNAETIMIGHSVGPAFIMSILERLDSKIDSCFFVAPFTGKLGLDIDEANSSFVERDFGWERIREACSAFYVYASDNDPYVPLANSKNVATHVGAEFILVKGGKHMNKAAGYDKFQLLLDGILKRL